MQNLPGISTGEQIPLHGVSDAITQRVLADVHAMRSDEGAGLAALLDQAILEGINRAFSIAAHAHATAVLGAERSVRAGSRAGYRSGTRTVKIGGPLGVMDVTLVKSRKGLLRPDFMKGNRPRMNA
jgi:transposase-like protein